MLKESMRTSRFFSRYRLPILSGFLIGTSYIPLPPWALFFCMTPLFLFWWRQAQTKRQAFLAGWLTQFILNLIGFHWIAYTASEFGHFPWWGGAGALIGFAAIAHLYYPVGGTIGFWLVRRLELKPLPALFTFMLSFAICDRLFASIFPWHLGYPWLWANLPGAQFSDVIGFEGLNIATILVNVLFAWAIAENLLRRPSSQNKKAWIISGAAVAFVLAINILGLGRDTRWKTTDAQLNVLAIQGNIGNFDKYMAESRYEWQVPIVRKFLEVSRRAIAEHPEANLIIWPETAFPAFLDQEYLTYPLQSEVRGLLTQNHMPLLTGSYSNRYRSKDTYNGLFYLNAHGQLTTPPYHKTILLVFGETFPFSDYIPYMDKFFPEQGSFARGSGPTVMNVHLDGGADPAGSKSQDVAIGAQICYEGLYPWFSAALARQGAQVFANVTNDSWFGKPFEPNQHLYMTLARAIEFRRPLFRVTNTGISTAVLASGEILEKSPIGTEWFGVFKIPYLKNPSHTFYEKFGGAWPWILTISLVLVVVFGRAKKRTDIP
jgi:apolipoprotein N-acyltransferase